VGGVSGGLGVVGGVRWGGSSASLGPFATDARESLREYGVGVGVGILRSALDDTGSYSWALV
jgi:hypothetical protein